MVVLNCSIYLAIDKTVKHRLAVNRFWWRDKRNDDEGRMGKERSREERKKKTESEAGGVQRDREKALHDRGWEGENER